MSDDPTQRIEALRSKIAALESLAANPSTTVPESEAAQTAANRLRLELSKRLRASGSQSQGAPSPGGASSPRSTAAPSSAARPRSTAGSRAASVPHGESEPYVATDGHAAGAWGRPPSAADSEAERTQPGVSEQGFQAAYVAGPPDSTVSPVAARKLSGWMWQLPLVASVAVMVLAVRVPLTMPSFSGAPGAGAGTAAVASERALGAAPALTGKAAVASAQACTMQRGLREFLATPAAQLRPSEDAVDVHRRCATYMKVRGIDDSICFDEHPEQRSACGASD